MDRPSDLRAAAGRYREMARLVTDPRTVDALNGLAAEYEARAAPVAAEKEGCPACGTDFR